MKRVLLLICCCVLLTPGPLRASDLRFSPRPNKAHLILWKAWGQGALEEAKKQDKLILLSLSAVWCHWCHVMDETTYSNEEIIGFINEHFIPVRVDSDMRPDIDRLYNQGGWPSTVIMTPQGEVLTGGTYVAADDLLARMTRLSDLYQNDRKAITGWVEETRASLAQRGRSDEDASHAFGDQDLSTIVQMLSDVFDSTYGGFGAGQKFPNPESIEFLLARYSKKKSPVVKRIVTTTLDHMAGGGLYDDVAGGFFRYSTKPDWSEPHYEKMLDVNAGMIRNYAEASLVFGSREYQKIMKKCIRYVRSNLYDSDTGAFFGSQDADETYYSSRRRKGKTSPAVDRTAYADSSALMVSALVSAYDASGEQQYLDMAKNGADYLAAELFDKDAGMYHFSRNKVRLGAGLLSDNVLVGSAMLDLYAITGEKRYLSTARAIDQLVRDRFYDATEKRFRFSLAAPIATPIAPGILSTVNDTLANYRAIRFMGRMLYIEESRDQKGVRDEALGTLSGTYQDFTPNAAAYGNALLWAIQEPIGITVIVDKRPAQSYLSAIRDVYVPAKSVRVLSLSEDGVLIKKLGYPKQEAAYLCTGMQCSQPITTPGKLKAALKRLLEQKGKE